MIITLYVRHVLHGHAVGSHFCVDVLFILFLFFLQQSMMVQVDECLLNITSHRPIHLIPLYRNDNVISKGKLLK